MVEVDLAVADLLGSMPQFSTLLQGKDLANIAGQAKGNRPSQEGGIFGGGCYAAESERDALTARNRPGLSNPVVASAPVAPAFNKPVNNASSIQGGCVRHSPFANTCRLPLQTAPPPRLAPPSGSTHPSAPSLLRQPTRRPHPRRIFGEAAAETDDKPPTNRSNQSNQSSIQGGIFGEAAVQAPPSRTGRNSNQSSIPGGIFG